MRAHINCDKCMPLKHKISFAMDFRLLDLHLHLFPSSPFHLLNRSLGSFICASTSMYCPSSFCSFRIFFFVLFLFVVVVAVIHTKPKHIICSSTALSYTSNNAMQWQCMHHQVVAFDGSLSSDLHNKCYVCIYFG